MKKITLSVVIGLIFVTVLFCNNVVKTKGADSKQHEHLYYISYKIQEGDTLWSIAKNYRTEEFDSINDYISEVKRLNNLGSSTIHEGRYIIIPYYTDMNMDEELKIE